MLASHHLPSRLPAVQCTLLVQEKKKKETKQNIWLLMQEEKEGKGVFGEKKEMQLRKYGSDLLHWRPSFKFLPWQNSYLLYYQTSIGIRADHGKCRFKLLFGIIQQELGSHFFQLSDDRPNCWTVEYYQVCQDLSGPGKHFWQHFVENILIKKDFRFPQVFQVCTQ